MSRSVQTVRNVERAITAVLKAVEETLLLTRSDEHKPSTADNRMDASPPQSNIVRKMNVSETVMCELSWGILVVMCGLAPTVIRARSMKRTSN
jgi:hypothetical protein